MFGCRWFGWFRADRGRGRLSGRVICVQIGVGRDLAHHGVLLHRARSALHRALEQYLGEE